MTEPDEDEYYKKLFEVLYKNEPLYKLLSPSHVKAIIKDVNSKLPDHESIWEIPERTAVGEAEERWVKIYGYFAIEGISEFSLLKATPTPLRIENGSYWIMDILIAIDYND